MMISDFIKKAYKNEVTKSDILDFVTKNIDIAKHIVFDINNFERKNTIPEHEKSEFSDIDYDEWLESRYYRLFQLKDIFYQETGLTGSMFELFPYKINVLNAPDKFKYLYDIKENIPFITDMAKQCLKNPDRINTQPNLHPSRVYFFKKMAMIFFKETANNIANNITYPGLKHASKTLLKQVNDCYELITKNKEYLFSLNYKNYKSDKNWFEIIYPLLPLIKETVKQYLPESDKSNTIKGFNTKLSDKQIELLYEKMQGNYFDTSQENFKAFLKCEPLDAITIKWIDKSITRHEPNKATIFEFLYLLKEYNYLDIKELDTTANNKNNLYSILKSVFPDINNFPQGNTEWKANKNTERKKELEAIIKSL